MVYGYLDHTALYSTHGNLRSRCLGLRLGRTGIVEWLRYANVWRSGGSRCDVGHGP